MSRFLAASLLAFAFAAVSNGQEWQRLGPDGGMVVSLGTGAGETVYLGTADGHVFASKDGAASWELRGRVGDRLDGVVTRLAVDAEQEKQVLAAVWFRDAAENGGVFRSEDGGRTWRPAGLEGEAVRALERAASKSSVVVAGTRTGVFRSQDGGGSWQRISPEGDPELQNVDSIAIDPRNPEVIYVGTYHLPWRTKDGGKSWERIIAGIIDDSDIMSLRLDSTNPDRVYMSACSGIYRSENQGAQWTKLQGIPYAARRTQTIVQDPGNPRGFYAGTTEGAWVTRDSGESWTRTTPKDWVVNSVVVLTDRSSHPGRIVMGTEAGIQVSDNNGESFAVSNRGFRHVIVKQLAAGFGGAGEILALVQRNGWELLKSTDSGKDWVAVPLMEAPPGKSALNAGQIAEVLGSPWGWMLRMANGHCWIQDEQGLWQQWKPKISPEVGRYKSVQKTTDPGPVRAEIEPEVMVFSGNSMIVAGDKIVARCDKAGVCRALRAFSGGPVNDIWTSHSGDQMAVLEEKKLGLSFDGGTTAFWRDVPAEQLFWIRGIERQREGEGTGDGQGTLVLGSSAGLFLSSDAGQHWVPSKKGLPASRIEAWLADSPFWLVSERSGGLYVSTAEGEGWSRVDNDAERGRLAGLVKIGERRVLVGSESEGILEVTVPAEK